MAACIPAQAALLVLINESPPATGNRSFAYLFTAPQDSMVMLTLTAFVAPIAIDYFKSVQRQGQKNAFGKYDLTVSDPATVPEPGMWLMTLGSIGLLGWMRLRNSEYLGY
jgi:hypothetical protein